MRPSHVRTLARFCHVARRVGFRSQGWSERITRAAPRVRMTHNGNVTLGQMKARGVQGQRAGTGCSEVSIAPFAALKIR
jgi:hypothetical protein